MQGRAFSRAVTLRVALLPTFALITLILAQHLVHFWGDYCESVSCADQEYLAVTASLFFLAFSKVNQENYICETTFYAA